MNNQLTTLPEERIENKIYLVRGKKVMFDRDLAELYLVDTKNLNKAVKRNKDRFPDDFMFQLSLEDSNILRFQFGTSSGSHGGSRYLPYAFTEQGIAMLSSILHSKRAIMVNIQIMRTFTKLREMLANNKELRQKIEQMEQKYDQQFNVIFEAIKSIVSPDEKPKSNIGFRT